MGNRHMLLQSTEYVCWKFDAFYKIISDILTPYWFKSILTDTASNIHLTQVTYVTCTLDRQQNFTYMHDMYVTSSTQKSTLHMHYAPPTFID